MFKRFFFSKTGLVTTSIVFIVFMAVVLPYFSSLSESMTNTSFSSDIGAFYSPAQFYENMDLYGQSGRDFYILMRWTFDIAWPMVYLSFFLSVIGHLSSGLNKRHKSMVFSFPIAAVVFDLLENTLATINVAIYPGRAPFLLRLLQSASLLKWIFILLTFMTIITLAVLHIYKKAKSID